MEAQKIIRVALHLMAESVSEVCMNQLMGIIGSEACLGVEIVEAQDGRIISIFTPEEKPAPEQESAPMKFVKGDKIVYLTDPATGLEAYGYVLYMQGDKVAVKLDGQKESRMVDPSRLRRRV